VQTFCSSKKISITCSGTMFVAVGIQHAMRMRHIVSCFLPASRTCFHIISQKAWFSEKTSYWTWNVYFSMFSTNVVWNISHFKKNWARCGQKTYVGLHVKYLLCLSVFNESWKFLDRFSKNTQISNFLKILHWEPSDRPTDIWRS